MSARRSCANRSTSARLAASLFPVGIVASANARAALLGSIARHAASDLKCARSWRNIRAPSGSCASRSCASADAISDSDNGASVRVVTAMNAPDANDSGTGSPSPGAMERINATTAAHASPADVSSVSGSYRFPSPRRSNTRDVDASNAASRDDLSAGDERVGSADFDEVVASFDASRAARSASRAARRRSSSAFHAARSASTS